MQKKQAFVQSHPRRLGIAFGALVHLLDVIIRVARTARLRVKHHSDYERWKDAANCLAWWRSRTEQAAKLIPEKSSVIEFGAGRGQLESFLKPGTRYVASDIVDRGPRTFICDLNKRPLPDLHYLMVNVAVFLGVLEYVHDLPTIVEWLSGQVVVCVLSYHSVNATWYSPRRLIEILKRAYNGYVSYYTENELESLFKKYGFACQHIECWRDQELFVFAKEDAGPTPLGIHSVRPTI